MEILELSPNIHGLINTVVGTKYNSYLDKNVWIQSPSYSGKEDYKLVKSSYRSIGKKKASGKNIVLTANDANWIFENCKKNTLVSVKKGKKKDTLPIDFSPVVKVSGKCGMGSYRSK